MPPPVKYAEKAWVEDKVIPGPRPYDIVIPIIGITGCGKSTLINTLLGDATDATRLVVSDRIEPCTQDIQFVVVSHPEAPKHRIVLLDTPGLNSRIAPDEQILKRIATWLEKSYEDDIKLAGVIFLWDINQPRELSFVQRNLARFERLCTGAATQNVVLATTKWTSPPQDSDIQHENELQQKQWKQLMRRGSRMCRLEEVSYDAAWKLVRFSLADAFTYDTEKILGELRTLKKKGDSQDLIAPLEKILSDQKEMAEKLKDGGLSDELWDDLVQKDRHIRDVLRQIKVKSPTLWQKVAAIFIP